MRKIAIVLTALVIKSLVIYVLVKYALTHYQHQFPVLRQNGVVYWLLYLPLFMGYEAMINVLGNWVISLKKALSNEPPDA